MKTQNRSRLLTLTLALAGIIFGLEMRSHAQTEVTLYDFASNPDGASPYAGLISDSAGNLYGTTEFGGALGWGTVFELARNSSGGWTETVLHSFSVSDGSVPMGGLVFDASGNLYGTTEQGGTNKDGVVFKLAPNGSGGWNETVLYSFHGYDGSEPRGTLIFDSNGNLYGTTTFGGINNCFSGCGVVFKLAPAASGQWHLTLLHKFSGGVDGRGPESGVVFDAAGNLYGTTEFGGFTGKGCASNSCGVAYELSPTSKGPWKETILHAFKLQADGGYPIGGVTLDSAGNVYGTAEFGGAFGVGVVFELSRSAGVWSETELFSFNSTDGGEPWAGVVFDSAGNLFGTTYNGGTHDGGVVYKLTPGSSGWTESVLYDFTSGGGAGAALFSPVLLDSSGNLFVTAANGGSFSTCSFGCGAVFEIEP
jgi:uncharacterized repeat protein (TIGR03803 family)